MALATTAKMGAKFFGLNTAVGVGAGVLDYQGRKAAGESVGSSAFNAFTWNILPSILFSSIPAQIAFASIQSIPAVMQGISSASRANESHMRQSAMPLSGYGFVPTASAMQSLQRGLDSMGKARGLGTAHAALASQALRRR